MSKGPYSYHPVMQYRTTTEMDWRTGRSSLVQTPTRTAHHVEKKTKTGTRLIAVASSAAYARKIARMLNADHEASLQD